MNKKRHHGGAAVLAVFLVLAPDNRAAVIGPSGYTNDFSARPSAMDFSTSSGIAGGSGDERWPAELL